MTKSARAQATAPEASQAEPQVRPLVVEGESVALQRLIDEVENGSEINLDGYNRTYNRHNR